jgi:hypothetical protein
VTTTQATLFDAPAAGRSRATDPETSHTARQRSTQELERQIVALVVASPGMTDDEIAAHFTQHHAPSVKSARSRTALIDSGETRLSNRGRPMIVWAAAARTQETQGGAR